VLLCWWRPHDSPAVVCEELDNIRSSGDASPDCLTTLLNAIDGVGANW
jgi:hypothetical protein